MADLGTGLRTYAIAQSEISDLCGSRWHPNRLPQNATLPAVVYWFVSGDEEQGLGSTRIGISHARLQIDAYATTHAAAVALADAIRNKLAGYRGTAGSVFLCGVSVDGSLRTDTEPREDGGDEPYHIASRDYQISFNDT